MTLSAEKSVNIEKSGSPFDTVPLLWVRVCTDSSSSELSPSASTSSELDFELEPELLLLLVDDDEDVADNGLRCGDSSVVASAICDWGSDARVMLESWGGLSAGGDDPGVRQTIDCSDTFDGCGGRFVVVISIPGFGNLITRIRVRARGLPDTLFLCNLGLLVG